MTPIALGALPSELPAPVGRCQIKRGVGNGTFIVNNTVNGQKCSDGSGPMQIQVTPRYPCWWVVKANVMSHGYDGGWQRTDWGIQISPADQQGITLGISSPSQNFDNSTVEWNTHSLSCMFRLAAGILYTASLHMVFSSGYNQRYHHGQWWIRIMGRIIGEGEA